MIAYTMVGTKHLKRAISFYEPIFAEMGKSECWRDDICVSWGDPSDEASPRFVVGYPFDEKEATIGNGAMTAFLIEETDRIDRLHALALQHGGLDEGKPGLRPQYGEGFYAAYVRDPDRNKLAFVCYDAGKD